MGLQHTLSVFIGIVMVLQYDILTAEKVVCTYYNNEKNNITGMNSIEEWGEIDEANGTIVCAEDGDKYCFTAWEEVNEGQIIISKQGCWLHAGANGDYKSQPCAQSECVTTRSPSLAQNKTVKFCCCLGNLCNKNFSDEYVPTPEPDPPTQGYITNKTFNYREETIIIALASVCSVAILTVVLYFLYRLWLGSRKTSMANLSVVEAPCPPPSFDMDNLKLMNVIGQGRFGNVWKGSLNEGTVAVKVFQGPFKPYYLNEKEIYSLPYMDNDCLLQMLAAEERITVDGMREYLLVLQYIPNGSLQNYLRNNTFHWMGMCVLGQSMASGLGYLHSEISKSGKRKPAIAHRDFNSRNILVKGNNTCVIADFGFSMQLSGSRMVRPGEEDTASISDVGTLRYMSPEVLDGAVNLRDCEVALKQVDVYAMGLVLWEIATRCYDLFPGVPVPDYQLPFEAIIGQHPNFEEMQVLVSREKKRPQFPDAWKENHHAVRSLKETMEDCWDQDAEARLTALCVEERMLELMTLWDKNKVVSPTVNPTSSAGTGTTQTTTDRNINLQNDHHGMGGNADDGINTTDTVDHNSNFTGMQHHAGRGRAGDVQNASAQGEEMLLDRNANVEHAVPPQRTVSREQSTSVSSTAERNVLSSLGFDRHSRHLSPDTISTSLSATSDINLGEFSCTQTVDPKNLHYSDEDMQGATTDLKFSGGYGSSLEYSVQSEPSTSPSRPLVSAEMRPSLARDQMTDNLSSSNVSVRPKQQNVLQRHTSIPSWGQLTVNQARARSISAASRGKFKTDTNRHREQLVAQRWQNFGDSRLPHMPGGMTVEGQVVNPLSMSDSGDSMPPVQSTSQLESYMGAQASHPAPSAQVLPPDRVKRPTSLALSAGLNGMKKKLVAMYVPHSSRSSKSAVQTGIAKMEPNEPQCYQVTVSQNDRRGKSKGKGSKVTAAQATREYSSRDLERGVAQAQPQEPLVVNVPVVPQPSRMRRDGYEPVSTRGDDSIEEAGNGPRIEPRSTALSLSSETSSEESRPHPDVLEIKTEKKTKRRSTPYKLITGKMAVHDEGKNGTKTGAKDLQGSNETFSVKMREGRKKGKDRRKVVSVDIDCMNKLSMSSSDPNIVPKGTTLSSSQSESSLHQNGNSEQYPNNKADMIGQAHNIKSPQSNNEKNNSQVAGGPDNYSANNNTSVDKVNSQNSEKVANGDIIKSPLIPNGHPVSVADGQYQLNEIHDTVVKPPPNAVETNDELSFRVSCL
ncbi:bone morphogenetic protein receptor type-2-like isoform X1 [Ptychodera flava]|uniref:bone morphogenetic protein receptor type-2-like isoform X1 n=1 Tax=Ptychodera flava TaxID=63121 RepID=UPI003969D57C